MDNIDVLLALRIFDLSYSKILIHRFKRTQIWTLPSIKISPIDDPVNYIEDVLTQVNVGHNFSIVAAIPIIIMDEEEEIWDKEEKSYLPKVFRSIIYELQYEGSIYLNSATVHSVNYTPSLWVNHDTLVTMPQLSRSTSILAKMMKKEACLS